MRYKRFLRQRSRTQKGVLVDLLCSEGRRLNTELRLALVPELALVAGPTVTYGPYCRW